MLVQEKQSKAYDQWNFPAGKVEIGKTIEQTAINEAKEEVGFDVRLIRKLNIFQDKAETPVRHAFEAEILGGELKFPADEILDAQWFTFSEIKAMQEKLRSTWIIETLKLLESRS